MSLNIAATRSGNFSPRDDSAARRSGAGMPLCSSIRLVTAWLPADFCNASIAVRVSRAVSSPLRRSPRASIRAPGIVSTLLAAPTLMLWSPPDRPPAPGVGRPPPDYNAVVQSPWLVRLVLVAYVFVC